MDLSVSGVAERDLDLLLLEEFAASPAFAVWFARRTAAVPLGDPPVAAARRSVTTSTGESDLEVALTDANGDCLLLLVENKIGASFQPRQAERYRERGDAYVRNSECRRYTTVLIAPQVYFGATAHDLGFDATMSYESIRDWYLRAEGPPGRIRYKIRLLTAGIEKAELGYQAIEDRPVSDFWHQYWLHASACAPELQMSSPGPRPAGAGFVWFRPAALPDDVTIVHKLMHGNVDLQLAGRGADVDEVGRTLGSHLDTDMTIERANRSAAIRIKVPALDTTSPFVAQTAAAEQGLSAAKRLLAWQLSNAHLFRRDTAAHRS